MEQSRIDNKNQVYNDIEKTKDGEKKETMKNIQELKEKIAGRIFSNLRPVAPKDMEEIEKEYTTTLENQQKVTVNEDYLKQKKVKFEKIFKKEKSPEYVGKFQDILQLVSKYGDEDVSRLKAYLNEGFLGPQEKKEIKEFIKLFKIENVENTGKRNIQFDKKIFGKEEFAEVHPHNIPCFFEEDQKGNRNFFSLNSLLNDIESFGPESGYPEISQKIPEEYKQFFPSPQRKIKFAFSKNLLAYYRDYQEILRDNLPDYEKSEEQTSDKKGMITEQLVERIFRHFANLEGGYNVKIKKSSISEDQRDKVDLIIQLQNKETRASVEKELQITINNNPEILKKKRKQIQDRENGNNEIELLKVELENIDRKINLWKKLKRPIGGLEKVLSIEDKKFLKETYDRLLGELKKKHRKK